MENFNLKIYLKNFNFVAANKIYNLNLSNKNYSDIILYSYLNVTYKYFDNILKIKNYI